MAGVHGTRLYGKVDHVPGLFYVSTMFWHFNYIPLIPLKSYVVAEGSEGNNAFGGKHIPLRGKSVVVGYLRGWLNVTAVFTTFLFGMMGAMYFFEHTTLSQPVAIAAALVPAIAFCWFLWLILSHRGSLLINQMMLIALSIAFHALLTDFCNPAKGGLRARGGVSANDIVVILIIANMAILLANLTRYLTLASYERALVLAGQFGIPRERIDAAFPDRQPVMAEIAQPE